ncbi:hypothetical protein E3N88_42753 [Mikania micrantha]|uniref:Reverse transcriptase zinc-binding domain-containing protein n=1 Tax=Mikania micrantha TaxID=192012 RepID=A0A5N6LGZ7_9ASTR|nr:hypothetical protein E3N88_42753 [Mikania micrantha]
MVIWRWVNLRLLAKWWWRFKTELEKLWRRTVLALHDSIRMPDFIPCKSIISGTWKNIGSIDTILLERDIYLRRLMKEVLGNGLSLRFWVDKWTGDRPLAELFPALYDLESSKSCCTADRMNQSGDNIDINWEWKRPQLGLACTSTKYGESGQKGDPGGFSIMPTLQRVSGISVSLTFFFFCSSYDLTGCLILVRYTTNLCLRNKGSVGALPVCRWVLKEEGSNQSYSDVRFVVHMEG